MIGYSIAFLAGVVVGALPFAWLWWRAVSEIDDIFSIYERLFRHPTH